MKKIIRDLIEQLYESRPICFAIYESQLITAPERPPPPFAMGQGSSTPAPAASGGAVGQTATSTAAAATASPHPNAIITTSPTTTGRAICSCSPLFSATRQVLRKENLLLVPEHQEGDVSSPATSRRHSCRQPPPAHSRTIGATMPREPRTKAAHHDVPMVSLAASVDRAALLFPGSRRVHPGEGRGGLHGPHRGAQGGSVGRWAGGSLGRWVSGPVGRWAGGWAGRSYEQTDESASGLCHAIFRRRRRRRRRRRQHRPTSKLTPTTRHPPPTTHHPTVTAFRPALEPRASR